MIAAFVFFLLAFTLIGLSSAFKSRNTRHDYYLADSSVPPWLVGLSAVATNNSGYMFIGVIGYTYATGLASIWLMLGWILGDFLASMFVHARLRAATEACDEVSYAGVLSRWYGANNTQLQRIMGLVSLVFLLAYASAQLIAGSKALHVLFDWPTWAGAVMGAVMVTLYCFAGGIRASIWTDAAQSVVMMLAMGLLLVVAAKSFGSMEMVLGEMAAIDGFLDWFPKDLVLPSIAGAVLFAVSWIFAGLSVIGQPHIMVRFMALKDNNKMRIARSWYYLWFFIFYSMATGVGLLSRIYLSDTGSFDAELALPTMAQALLPPVLVGLILAGICAATMSTADSLVLSCSAALTHDLLPHRIEHPLLIKAATITITGMALLLTLANNQSVFSLVVLAWSALASAFAPLLVALCLGLKPSQAVSILSLVAGLATALLWRHMDWHEAIYEGLPGMLAGLLILWVGCRAMDRSVASAIGSGIDTVIQKG